MDFFNEVEISGAVVEVNAQNSYVIKTTGGVFIPVFCENEKNIAAKINDILHIKGELSADTSLFVNIKSYLKNSIQ